MTPAGSNRDLVLVGGGHTHALVLRQLAMRPPAGARITLISDGSHTPYSGMLPGLIAGHYRFDDTHIDLYRLCGRLGVRFISARVVGLDLARRELRLQDRPAIGFDLLSINIGSQPDLASVPGAADNATPVKPVAGLWRRWHALERRLAENSGGRPPRIAVVGGGAGSVELALAMRHRLEHTGAQIRLICGGDLLEGYNRRALAAVRRACRQQSVEVVERTRIARVDAERLYAASGGSFEFDELIWCTSAVAAPWLRESGLHCDERGFVLLHDSLQVKGEETIFAAGDAATQTRHPRPKAGVYAVRQAPVLAANLRAALSGGGLRTHSPQSRFLSLLSLGGRSAVADRGRFSASGSWVWRWKDRIDRKFMARFTDLPEMSPAAPAEQESVMHCGGCGAKLPATMLRRVLTSLAEKYPTVLQADSIGDDAALVEWAPQRLLVQTVDTLRSLVDDPWIMGRIAVLHSLSDIYAMGASPHSALAHITLPYASPRLQERDLEQFMSGAARELAAANCRLLGGHSLEGPELAAGFTANGEAAAAQVLAKDGARVGDHLILTKALGTGALFAAFQQGVADGRWMCTAVESMMQSNGEAAAIARRFGASACTDITGFGLLGHLFEMLQRAPLQAVLALDPLPLLPGTADVFAEGIESSLQAGNVAAVAAELEGDIVQGDARYKALFDPQTSGGLLLAIDPASSGAALQALWDSGYRDAVEIGELRPLENGAGKLKLSVA